MPRSITDRLFRKTEKYYKEAMFNLIETFWQDSSHKLTRKKKSILEGGNHAQ